MMATDVNVLLYALRQDSERHGQYRDWLLGAVRGGELLAVFEPVQGSFLRISTHPGIYKTPTPAAVAWEFLDRLLAAPNVLPLRAGERHWDLFRALCTGANCRGNLIQDAYLAALAMEHNCEWITTDGDFARFPALRWRPPFPV